MLWIVDSILIHVVVYGGIQEEWAGGHTEYHSGEAVCQGVGMIAVDIIDP